MTCATFSNVDLLLLLLPFYRVLSTRMPFGTTFLRCGTATQRPYIHRFLWSTMLFARATGLFDWRQICIDGVLVVDCWCRPSSRLHWTVCVGNGWSLKMHINMYISSIHLNLSQPISISFRSSLIYRGGFNVAWLVSEAIERLAAIWMRVGAEHTFADTYDAIFVRLLAFGGSLLSICRRNSDNEEESPRHGGTCSYIYIRTEDYRRE